MKIRFYNAQIYSMEDGIEVFSGEVWVEDERITYVGPKKESGEVWNREIDCKGNLLMPGFKNAHTHSAMTFLRSSGENLELSRWLQDVVFPAEAKLTPEDIYHLSKLAILEYVSGGTTANFDMYLDVDAIASASEDCGFRTVIVSGLNDFTHSVENMEDCYRRYNRQHGLVSFQLGFHAEYTTSEHLLKGVAELAHKYHAPVYTHLEETASEVESCIERHGMRPAVYLDSLGMFDYGGGGFHCTHMTGESLAVFAEKKLSAVINMGSNVKLASGLAPVKELLLRGVPLALGTDGPSSNNALDMFREMYLAAVLSKIRENDPSVLAPEEVLAMATKGGACAMKLKDSDSLAPGKYADLILVDLHQPNMQPGNDLICDLVYSCGKQNVKLTMVHGRVLYEDGEYHIGEDPERIYRKAKQIIKRVQA